MINRPSYAQRTLELTRRSLQFVPPHLTPVVSGVVSGVTAPVPAHDDHVVTPSTAFARLVDLQRWKRKAALPTRRAGLHSRTAARHTRTAAR